MEWLIGGPAGWQEVVAAAIVAGAVVSLYRHLRGMFGGPSPSGGGAGCHGCASDCDVPDPAAETATGIKAVNGSPPAATPVTTTLRGTLH